MEYAEYVYAAARDHIVPLCMLQELDRQVALGLSSEQADAWIIVLGECQPVK